MNSMKRWIAAAELLLVLPAALFMSALFARNLQPPQYEPARSARLLVEWFSARPVLGLYVFLIGLPLTVFVIGFFTVWRNWYREEELRRNALVALKALRAHLATWLIALATVWAGGILAIVALPPAHGLRRPVPVETTHHREALSGQIRVSASAIHRIDKQLSLRNI